MSKRDKVREMVFNDIENSGQNLFDAVINASKHFGITYATAERYMRAKPKKNIKKNNKRLIYIPDTQIKVGGETGHLVAAAKYIVKKKPAYVVFSGDWHDMPSLSVFNTKKGSEGLRVYDDIRAGNDALDEFMEIINTLPKNDRPEVHITLGNHSCKVRIERYLQSHPELDGMLDDIGTKHFHSHGIIVHDFLEIAKIEGIAFSHYFANPHSLKGSPVGGTMDNMLKNVGMSFFQGHQQGLKMTKHYLGDGTCRIGVSAGSFYPHDEDYMSPQANKHWRGMVMVNELDGNGGGDLCEISLRYLMENYAD